MTDIQVALELLKTLLNIQDNPANPKNDTREGVLALYRKCLEAVRTPPADH